MFSVVCCAGCCWCCGDVGWCCSDPGWDPNNSDNSPPIWFGRPLYPLQLTLLHQHLHQLLHQHLHHHLPPFLFKICMSTETQEIKLLSSWVLIDFKVLKFIFGLSPFKHIFLEDIHRCKDYELNHCIVDSSTLANDVFTRTKMRRLQTQTIKYFFNIPSYW